MLTEIYEIISLEKGSHFDNFVITGGTISCCDDIEINTFKNNFTVMKFLQN